MSSDILEGRASKAIARRRKMAIESYKSAAETLGKIEPGLSIFTVTRGQFSMIDVINHYLSEMGKARLSLWTWAIASFEVECVEGLLQSGRVLSARLIVDFSAGRRNPVMLDRWRDRFGVDQVRVCKNHAKIARIWSDDYRILARGSCNLNFNPRFENLDVSEGGQDFELVSQIEDELPVLPRAHSNAEAIAATRLGAAFDKQTLEMFQGVQEWKP